jgi:hypothetical protein
MKTKTEYVKVEFANDKELAKAYSEMDLYFKALFGDDPYVIIKDLNKLEGLYYCGRSLFKKVEVDVKKDLKNYIKSCKELTGGSDFNMFSCDSGLDSYSIRLWEKEFIGACHLIAELTDDPRGEL